MTALADVGEARAVVVEPVEHRVHRHHVAQQCMELAARLMVLASELDPDMPAVVARGVATVPADWRGTGPERAG